VNQAETVTPLTRARSPARLLVVSNRLPVVLNKNKANGEWTSQPGSGGLVSALMPVLRDRGGVWVGWPGIVEEHHAVDTYLDAVSGEAGYGLKGVHLTGKDVAGFYEGFSNEIIWPLFHDLPMTCRFEPGHWRAYQRVNANFARQVAAVRKQADVTWVHDYHLMGVAARLRRLGISGRIGFFLHIPFPPPDIFLKLPWRADILSGLLDYDLIGFQTLRDCRNFQRCLKTLYRVRVRGKGQVQDLEVVPLSRDVAGARARRLRTGSFPISIDFGQFDRIARRDETLERIAELESLKPGIRMFLSVDRLDYTKGLLEKLQAFRLALERYPPLRGSAVLSMHVVPSRETIPDYHRLRTDLEQLISQINGEWSRPGWIPVHYYYHSMPVEELTAFYRRADVMLVSPLKDGMNLVAKEYCASHPENDGILILSEFAGAAAELQHGALLINPYDTERMAESICLAAMLDRANVSRRMSELRAHIRRHDIYRWVNAYLNAMAGRAIDDFPRIADYVPGLPPEGLVAGL